MPDLRKRRAQDQICRNDLEAVRRTWEAMASSGGTIKCPIFSGLPVLEWLECPRPALLCAWSSLVPKRGRLQSRCRARPAVSRSKKKFHVSQWGPYENLAARFGQKRESGIATMIGASDSEDYDRPCRPRQEPTARRNSSYVVRTAALLSCIFSELEPHFRVSNPIRARRGLHYLWRNRRASTRIFLQFSAYCILVQCNF